MSAPVAMAQIDLANEPVQPVPAKADLDPAKVKLGERLFFDVRLSSNKILSCATCHNPQTGGTIPGVTTSVPGASGKTVPINIPSVLNSGADTTQFWNGRAATLEDQVNGPLENQDEMGGNWNDVLALMESDEAYKTAFDSVYGGKITADNARDAIATFERSLTTHNAPFDRYLNGDEAAISAQAKRGYEVFKEIGCTTCHTGSNVGGNMFMAMSEDYFKDRGTEIIDQDKGRFTETGDEADMYVFRVPPLRNVAVTAPYLHDGKAETLEQAVEIMAKYQLGLEDGELSTEDRDAIVAFLKSLHGELAE
ncbi:MAG: c-type cytochrome [Rhodospirillales bacterium]|nr:c-type cytochrome [Rhodospirillales bacterium]